MRKFLIFPDSCIHVAICLHFCRGQADHFRHVQPNIYTIISGMKEQGLIPDPDLTIFHSTLFNEMIEKKELISNIVADETNYKEKAASRKKGDTTDYVGKLIRQKMARKTVWPNLQMVYQHLQLRVE